MVSMLFFCRHVHSGCDPDANEQSVLEKRASQLNYMFVCRICKSGGRSALTPATPSSALGCNDDSNDASWEDMDNDSGVGGGTLSLGRSLSFGGGTGGGGGVLMPMRAEVKLGGLRRVSARPRGLNRGLEGAGGGDGEGVSLALWYSAS